MSSIKRYNQILFYDRKLTNSKLNHRWFLVTIEGVLHSVFTEMYEAYPHFKLWLVMGTTYGQLGQRVPYLQLIQRG